MMTRPERRGVTAARDPAVRLSLLGGFRAERGDRIVSQADWERPTARALVKLLAVHPGHQLHREQIMELLWPELRPESALQSLRNAVSRARKALEPERRGREAASCLVARGELVLLDPRSVWIDADRFRELSRRALATGTVADLEAARDAYGGELLPDDAHEEWTRSHRDTLEQLHKQVLTALANAYGAAGRHEEAAALRDVRAGQMERTEVQRRVPSLPGVADGKTWPDAAMAVAGIVTERRSLLVHAALPHAVRRAPETELVGREDSLRLLIERLEAARKGTGGMVLVSGEPGVGKTRLMAELAREAGAQGALVLWGTTYGHDSLLPGERLIEALHGYVRTLDDGQRAELTRGHPQLGRILHLDAHGAGDAMEWGVPADERPVLFAAIVRFLTDLSEETPVVLALDDIHLMDATSLHVLGHVMRLSPERRWMLVGTYRMEETGALGFAELVSRAIREGICRRIGLMRLDRASIRELVRRLLPGGEPEDALVETVATRSLGNPLFILELVRMMRAREIIARMGESWRLVSQPTQAVPDGVRDLVRARLAGLGESEKYLLQLSAVAGEDATFALLRHVASVDERTLVDSLDQVLQARILEERGDRYVFEHPLFREATYEGLSRPRRRYLHGLVADALERLEPGNVEAPAHHRGVGGESDAVVLD